MAVEMRLHCLPMVIQEHAAPAFDLASAQARAMELAYGRREEAWY